MTSPAPATIRFEAVTVQYPGRSVAALDGCTLEIPSRGLVALTGPTGSGKSTVVATLLRFIEPDAGAIAVGDRSLAAIDATTWRAELSWAPQSPWIFAGTVADNLRLGRPGATLDELRAAAEAADIDTFIESLPMAYDTLVGEQGLRLSGGERQRLAIARAFVRPSSVLILDEPTSNLDERSQAVVVASLRRFATERSVIVVSHRQPVVDVADAVIRLEHGRVVRP